MLDTGLDGRVCLVTGAAKGIGLACAQLLGGEGAKLALADIDADALERADVDAEHVVRVAGDMSQRADVERTLATTRDELGGLDALLHCAGIYRTTPLPEVTDDEWQLVIDVNLRSAFLLAQGAVEIMRDQPHGGSIVLFGSFAARTGGLRASAPYAASKAGVEGITRHVAQYAGPLGVRVNCIHPGFTETPMTAVLDDDARSEAAMRTPLRRHAPPEEQATVAVVLASDLARFVHGATVDVNGGMYMA